MNKIAEIKQEPQDIQNLIEKMEYQLQDYRYMVYRYHLMHGEEIQGLEVELPDNIDFKISDNGITTTCKQINYKEIGIESDYMQIIKELQKLRA